MLAYNRGSADITRVRVLQRYQARIRQALAAWAGAEAGRFILFLPVCLAAGIVGFFAWHGQPPASPAILVATVCMPAAWALRAHGLSFALVCAAVAAIGFAAAQEETARAPPFPDLPRHASIVTGRVATLDRLPEGRRVTLAAPSLDGQPPLARTLRIRLRNTDESALAPGDMIQIRVLLRPPAPPAYPGAWDTQRDAYFAGLAGYGFAIGPAMRLHAAPVTRWQAWRGAIQDRILAALPGARGAIAATLLTGLGSAIPQADRSAFQDSGLAHLLAVAGLHIGIVMALTFGVCRRGLAWSEHAALHWPCKPIAAAASLGAGLFYLALTGAHVPILRSFAMACVVTLALITGRRALSLRGLALAAMVLMLASPDLVMGVSFQMSFAAVMALIAGWDALAPHLIALRGPGWARFLARHAIAGVATSVLAGTASLPIAAYHFGNATLYYVPANLLAVPLTALWVMPWGLAALALMPVGLHGLALAPMGWGIAGLLWIAHAVSAWPDARIPLGQVPASRSLCLRSGLPGFACGDPGSAWPASWRWRPGLPSRWARGRPTFWWMTAPGCWRCGSAARCSSRRRRASRASIGRRRCGFGALRRRRHSLRPVPPRVARSRARRHSAGSSCIAPWLCCCAITMRPAAQPQSCWRRGVWFARTCRYRTCRSWIATQRLRRARRRYGWQAANRSSARLRATAACGPGQRPGSPPHRACRPR